MNISKKKPFIPISKRLYSYLEKYERGVVLPIEYKDLMNSHESIPLLDKKGNNTLWDTLLYTDSKSKELDKNLVMLYSLLKTEGDVEITGHLRAERIDFCHFANSQPYRIKIVNMLNDNHDYMYIKKADASRVYGLELEHLLSPNYISYFVHSDTLVEEHIAGIPGDVFYDEYITRKNFNKVRFAKEFVKFNERCFIRLLGDMRSYNYVVAVTPDFDDEQYRIKAIDFDQQSYEGRKNIYLPQYFKENNPIVRLGMEFMTVETTRQYQFEERTLMARRYNMHRKRIFDLIVCMKNQKLSEPSKIEQLKKDLNDFYSTTEFDQCKNMGDILQKNLLKMLADHVTKLDIIE